MTDHPDPKKLRTGEGDWIGPDELQELLADEGYSAGHRKQFLKSVLTELSQEESDESKTPKGREELLAEVRRILSHEQDKEGRDPKSDDV